MSQPFFTFIDLFRDRAVIVDIPSHVARGGLESDGSALSYQSP
jgi:hypothetical protein